MAGGIGCWVVVFRMRCPPSHVAEIENDDMWWRNKMRGSLTLDLCDQCSRDGCPVLWKL